jgi:hypothetical protein
MMFGTQIEGVSISLLYLGRDTLNLVHFHETVPLDHLLVMIEMLSASIETHQHRKPSTMGLICLSTLAHWIRSKTFQYRTLARSILAVYPNSPGPKTFRTVSLS